MQFGKCLCCKEPYIKNSPLKVCSKCDAKLFPIIEKFTDENPENDIQMIADGTGINEKIIRSYYDSGSLYERKNINEDSKKCDTCGKEFNGVGSTCKNCLEDKKNKIETLNKLLQSYETNTSTNTDKKSSGMRHFKY